MDRLDEMIYHLETMSNAFYHNIGTTLQSVDGKDRPCCTFCGHCPEAEAEWLRAIKQELQANTKPKRELALSKDSVNESSDSNQPKRFSGEER